MLISKVYFHFPRPFLFVTPFPLTRIQLQPQRPPIAGNGFPSGQQTSPTRIRADCINLKSLTSLASNTSANSTSAARSERLRVPVPAMTSNKQRGQQRQRPYTADDGANLSSPYLNFEPETNTIGIHIGNFLGSQAPATNSTMIRRQQGIPIPIRTNSQSPTRPGTSVKPTKHAEWINDPKHPYRLPLVPASLQRRQTPPSRLPTSTNYVPAQKSSTSSAGSGKGVGFGQDAKNNPSFTVLTHDRLPVPNANNSKKPPLSPSKKFPSPPLKTFPNAMKNKSPPSEQGATKTPKRDVVSAPTTSSFKRQVQNVYTNSQYNLRDLDSQGKIPSTTSGYGFGTRSNQSRSRSNFNNTLVSYTDNYSNQQLVEVIDLEEDVYTPSQSRSYVIKPKKQQKSRSTVAERLMMSFPQNDSNRSVNELIQGARYSLDELYNGRNDSQPNLPNYRPPSYQNSQSKITSLQQQPRFPMNPSVVPYFPNHYLHLPAPYVPRQGPSTDIRFYSTGPPLLRSAHGPNDPRFDFMDVDESMGNLNLKEQTRQKLRQLRKWESTTLGRLYQDSNRHGSRSVDDGTQFTLLSYNVLAPSLLKEHQNHLYQNVDPQCLDWDSRHELFFQELADFGYPQILCFQEVEATLFNEMYETPLGLKGYQGIFKKRTGDKVDGCAIFWKQSLFTLLAKLPVEYFQPHVPLLDRDNIALLVKLQSKIGRRPKVVVGTTHLLFNPKRNDVKLAQVQIILSELDRFAFSGYDNKGEATYHPTILTGDFNTESRSSIIRLLTDGELQYTNQNGERPRLLMRKGMNDFIPNYVGVSDQCQHYRVVLERYNEWKKHRRNTFELDLKQQQVLVNLFSSQIIHNDGRLSGSSTRLTNQQISTQVDPETHALIMNDIYNSGTVCTFGAGELSHKLRLCDIYQPKLDRAADHSQDSIATTKQTGWVCVDFIFYSKLWNEELGRRVEGNLKLLRRLGLLTRTQCKDMGSLPSFACSSDHYPLLAEFVLK